MQEAAEQPDTAEGHAGGELGERVLDGRGGQQPEICAQATGGALICTMSMPSERGSVVATTGCQWIDVSQT